MESGEQLNYNNHNHNSVFEHHSDQFEQDKRIQNLLLPSDHRYLN